MSGIEFIICLLLFMTIPDFCRWIGRPALRYPLFVLFGLALSPIAESSAAAVLFGWRLILQRRIVPTGGDDRSLLLICPNLTIAALVANVLLTDGSAPRAAVWIMLTGLFMTVPAIMLLPRADSGRGGRQRGHAAA